VELPEEDPELVPVPEPVELQELVLLVVPGVVLVAGVQGQLGLPSHWKKLPQAVAKRVTQERRTAERRWDRRRLEVRCVVGGMIWDSPVADGAVLGRVMQLLLQNCGIFVL
jgi:hypothetical protein